MHVHTYVRKFNKNIVMSINFSKLIYSLARYVPVNFLIESMCFYLVKIS